MSDYGQSAEGRVTAHRTGERHTLKQSAAGKSTFVSDGTANKAIAHGLGIVPGPILIQRTGAYGIAVLNNGKLTYTDSASTATYDVTPADATNFYVGNVAQMDLSMNGAGAITHYWAAVV